MKNKLLLISSFTLFIAMVLTGCGQSNNAKAGNATSAAASTKHTSKTDKKRHSSSLIYQYLGLSKIAFKKDRKKGMSIVDIAKEQNKSEQQVLNYMVQQRNSQFKQKKKLSESQLSKKKAAITQKIKKKIESQKKPKKKQGGGQ